MKSKFGMPIPAPTKVAASCVSVTERAEAIPVDLLADDATFAIGTFFADGTSQTLSLEATNFAQAHISAYQIRELVSPSTVFLTPPANAPFVDGPFSLSVAFSKEVTGLELSDFVVNNASTSNLVAIDASNYTLDITPSAQGSLSIQIPTGSVENVGDIATNSESNLLVLHDLAPGTFLSGTLDLSGRDTTGLGAGEGGGFFSSPKTFDSISDLSLDDIPWTDGTLSGTFDLNFVATSSLAGIRRGGKGGFGTADDASGGALVDSGEFLELGTFVASDLRGDLSELMIDNIQVLAVYLGNASTNDGATINGLVASGAPGGDTTEEMRNEILQSPLATIAGTGTGNGYSVNGIEISFMTSPRIEIVSCEVNDALGFDVTYSGLSTDTTYELRHSPDMLTPFTLVEGTAKTPGTSTDVFTDPSPTLPGKGFYQLFVSPLSE